MWLERFVLDGTNREGQKKRGILTKPPGRFQRGNWRGALGGLGNRINKRLRRANARDWKLRRKEVRHKKHKKKG